MLMDFEIRCCSRTCAATSRTLQPGEVYFSVLDFVENDLLRRDYSVEAWQGPPEACVGWWRSRLPIKGDTQPRLAPTDVMLNLFESLENRPAEFEFRYLLGLLLVRRRTLRRDDHKYDDQGREVLILHCGRRDKDYDLVVAEPSADRALKLQQQMFDLLYGNADLQIPPAEGPQS